MTKSKTKLVTGNRKGTVKRSIIENAVKEVYSNMGIEYPQIKLSKTEKVKK